MLAPKGHHLPFQVLGYHLSRVPLLALVCGIEESSQPAPAPDWPGALRSVHICACALQVTGTLASALCPPVLCTA